MIRKLPLLPSIIVALAVATMIGLGIWQLSRASEKDALLDRYEAARNQPPIAFPTAPIGDSALPLFRKASGFCLRPATKRVTAGRNAAGDTGFVHIVECTTGAEGPGMAVEIGFSKNPSARYSFTGGEVRGLIVPDRKMRLRLVAERPAAGLQPSVPPSIADIPNNHRSYAVQWFLFAGIALLIYLLALRMRNRPAAAAPKP